MTLAVLGNQLDSLATQVGDIRTRIDSIAVTMTSSATALAVLEVERKRLSERVERMESDANRRHIPWTATAAVIIAGASLAVTVLPQL